MPDIPRSGELVKFGSFELNLHTGELRRKGHRRKLQQQPFQILAVLVQRKGQLVTREELIEQLWPGAAFGDHEHGLNKAVNKLREVLDDSTDTPRYIETLPKRGYRFIAALTPAAPHDQRPQDKGKAVSARDPWISVWVFLAILAFLILVGWIVFATRRHTPRQVSPQLGPVHGEVGIGSPD